MKASKATVETETFGSMFRRVKKTGSRRLMIGYVVVGTGIIVNWLLGSPKITRLTGKRIMGGFDREVLRVEGEIQQQERDRSPY